MKKIIIVLTIVLAIFAASCARQPAQIGCTLEAKVCPDGSSVGRSGPNCEFAPCPGNQEAPGAKPDAAGRSYFKTEPNCVINFMCIRGTKAFSDSTGCGCEPDGTTSPDNGSPPENTSGAQGTMPAGKLAAIDCKEDQRNAEACTLEYMPVCGWFGTDIKCIKYPCAQTYGNICQACANPNVAYYTVGECPQEGDLAKI